MFMKTVSENLTDQKYGRYRRFSLLEVINTHNFFHCIWSKKPSSPFYTITSIFNDQFVANSEDILGIR